ncbi:unnamed protein product, partial [Polarella glacialis]
MVSLARVFMLVLIVACALMVLFSFSQTHHLVTTRSTHDHLHGSQHIQSGSALISRLLEFPAAVEDVERRLLSLEKSIQDFDVKAGQEGGGSSEVDGLLHKPSGGSPGAAAASGPGPGAGDGASVLKRWRADKKCGKNSQPLSDGKPTGCDPEGPAPCCSKNGWCGNSPAHCSCRGCISYAQHKAAVQVPSENTVSEPKPSKFPPAPTHDGHKGKTVVVIIPFRDREYHLTLFKKFWRWFAQHGREPKSVQRWEVFVMEQFDSMTFNRGWNFNVGLAVASAQKSASSEVSAADGIDFDCAVIQDIDYLPEKGVDYGECDVPIQLSSEIDRYNWKTPYLTSAGGIVGMSLKHWRKINGFGNNYFGWGGEDDELHHRLRLNKLLYGDCYPFCKSSGDPNTGKPGLSIMRPKMGFGRFTGKLMHSANHTKRITDSKAYDANVLQLKEIEQGGSRWKTDGLSSLAFHIVDHDEDTTDKEEFGITYHHIRAKRGKEPFDVRLVPMAVPPGFCSGSVGTADASSVPGSWIIRQLGPGAIPW